MQKFVSVGEIFTEQEVRKALAIWRQDRYQFRVRALDEIVRPAMPRINKKLEQENHEGYIAYVLEYTVMIMIGEARR